VSATSCPDCAAGLDHCHAVWIGHADGHEECIEVTCRHGADVHHHLVMCIEVDRRCCG
jgi:hypothetical protein